MLKHIGSNCILYSNVVVFRLSTVFDLVKRRESYLNCTSVLAKKTDSADSKVCQNEQVCSDGLVSSDSV